MRANLKKAAILHEKADYLEAARRCRRICLLTHKIKKEVRRRDDAAYISDF